tara:strand:+ start:234308 stop:234475 length:168 start_codon:yes stop_codon:yes gene_type:complete
MIKSKPGRPYGPALYFIIRNAITVFLRLIIGWDKMATRLENNLQLIVPKGFGSPR